ncbi:T9SS type A sorting domain-containing protein [Rasiella sp. SM2506]|uniref:T9SS type A sorting domain-containing protein n=1 Tax=Rasiella sp. SM2506 TaxID=3423914 RepID=UPI003D7C0A10
MKKFFLALCVLSTSITFGQDGSLDTSFGDNGLVDIDYENSSIDVGGVNQFSDGSYIVLAGKLESDEKSILIHKFLNNGSLDTSFGDNGILTYLPTVREDPRATYIVEEDKILYVFNKEAQGNFFKKFLPDGTLDTSFGANGELEPFPGEFNAQLRFNKFNSIVAGLKLGTTFRVKRFLLNGDPDTSFGDSGMATIQGPSSITFYQSFKITSDNKILITAEQQVNGEKSPIIFQANQDGSIDTSFGTNGFVEIPYVDPNDDFVFNSNGVQLFEDGSILIISIYNFPAYDLAKTRIYKMSSEGELITAVGSGGEITGDGLPRVIIQENQRFLVMYQPIGMVGTGGRVGISRYFSNGFEDSSFSFDRAAFPILTNANFLIDSDGKVVVSGGGRAFEDFFMYRLNNNPLGIEENTQNIFTVFPNPANDFITISCTECYLTNKPYQITDTSGKVIQQANFSVENPTVSMEGFANGLYYLTIENTTVKLVKQ